MRWNWNMGLGRDLGSVFWAMVFLEGAFGAYFGILPLWIEHLGAPVTVVGLVLGSSGLLRLFVLLPSAALGERFDIKRLIVGARIMAGFGLIAAALAGHWTHLFLMVVGSAIGELAFPLVQAHVAAIARGNRVRAFTLVFTVGPSVALVISPLLSGLLVALWGMRAAFVLAAIFTAISVTFFTRMERVAPVDRASRDEPAASYRSALADTNVRRVLTLHGATIFALAVGTSLVPTFLQDVRGLDPARIASLGAGAAVGSALFGLAVARIVRLQRAPFVGVSVAVACTVVCFVIFVSTGALPWVALAFVLRGGFFSAWALFAAALGEIAPERHRARGFAMIEMLGGGAYSFAPMFAGQLYSVRAFLPLTVAIILSTTLIPLLLRAQRSANRAAAQREPSPELVVSAPAAEDVTT